MLEGHEIAIIGIPTRFGTPNDYSVDTPYYLRTLGIVGQLERNGAKVSDIGDVICAEGESQSTGNVSEKNVDRVFDISQKTANLVAEQIRTKKKVLAIGGDHSMSIGTILGALEACNGDLGVIWIDTHGDINTHKTTLTGNIHGMPVAVLMGLGHAKLRKIFEGRPTLKPENILYVGIHEEDLDPAEKKLLADKKISLAPAAEVRDWHGSRETIKKINELCRRVGNVWVSFDVDVLDKNNAPGTPMENPDGLWPGHIRDILYHIASQTQVVGMDIAELMPANDENQITGNLAIELATLALDEGNGSAKFLSRSLQEAYPPIRTREDFLNFVGFGEFFSGPKDMQFQLIKWEKIANSRHLGPLSLNVQTLGMDARLYDLFKEFYYIAIGRVITPGQYQEVIEWIAALKMAQTRRIGVREMLQILVPSFMRSTLQRFLQ